MDNSIVRWYNKNRKSIWIILLTIVAVIGLIQTLNNYYKNQEANEIQNNKTTIIHNSDNYSIVTQEKIDEKVAEESISVIDIFFEYCNNKEIESAYDMLSAECKEELYPTINDFKTKYYDRIFTEYKDYKSMLWITCPIGNVYRIEIMADMLATGKKDYMPIEDYYTIIDENGEHKLSISNYIGKENINISKEENNIIINVISKEIYMDYEIYKIQIQNNSGSKVIFNSKENTKSMYIKDENDLKYVAFINEISNIELEILYGTTRTLEIKFNRGFKPTIDIEEIIFEDIIINNESKTIKVEI